MLLFEFVGLLLLRFATRQLVALLFQLPPRFTRFAPDDHRPELGQGPATEAVGTGGKQKGGSRRQPGLGQILAQDARFG